MNSLDFENKSPAIHVAGLFARLRAGDIILIEVRPCTELLMVSQNVNKLLQQSEFLTLEEREQFIELLRNQSAQKEPKSSEHELASALAKKGIKLTIPPKPAPEEIARFRAWKPIKMPGGSLSDELVRDRR
jgi:hypothetical protein